ncbi:Glycine--tRNA ligase protein [Dioscorea alata]|uniref:Glycine--tRNA ligase protein n=1 Tax=Dioscorea alata TaxID=55571 RepID=A0ACB7U647_DIOAL|nr:Glycine--tRNA ligase protein [Dioscorea alata]
MWPCPMQMRSAGCLGKTEYVYVQVKESARFALEVLAEELPKIISNISFPKSMRWYSKEWKANIARDSTSLTDSVAGCKVMDDNLLNEVANLVEAPAPVMGKFDKAFLELPKDILIMASTVSPLVSIEKVQNFGFYPTASIGGAEGPNQSFFDPYVSAFYSAAPVVLGFCWKYRNAMQQYRGGDFCKVVLKLSLFNVYFTQIPTCIFYL